MTCDRYRDELYVRETCSVHGAACYNSRKPLIMLGVVARQACSLDDGHRHLVHATRARVFRCARADDILRVFQSCWKIGRCQGGSKHVLGPNKSTEDGEFKTILLVLWTLRPAGVSRRFLESL